MALSVADFRAAYPEFNQLPSELVSAQLALAEPLCPRDVWDRFGDEGKGDLGVGLLTAAALRRGMGKAAKGPPSEYQTRFDELVKAIAPIMGGP